MQESCHFTRTRRIIYSTDNPAETEHHATCITSGHKAFIRPYMVTAAAGQVRQADVYDDLGPVASTLAVCEK
jgi:hypothetical protein